MTKPAIADVAEGKRIERVTALKEQSMMETPHVMQTTSPMPAHQNPIAKVSTLFNT